MSKFGTGDLHGLTTWTRSMPFVEMMRAAAVALNEALILAYYIFGH
jgi:hypothetical protein